MGIEQTDIGSSNKMNSTCVQPVIAAGAGGYHHHRQSVIGQGPLMLSQSPEPAWQYGGSMVAMAALVKQEPIDEARNDSGITSGSDGCPSASPGSDRSENHPYSSPPQNNNHHPVHNATQFMNTPNYQQWYRSNFMSSPSTKEQNPDTQDTNSQISNGSNGYQPSLSPKIESGDEIDTEQDIRVPKVNSHGKIKVHKCKQCEFIAYTKLDFWEHSKMHIKGDKILKCPKCPFVTEYKHHLEYHLLNHAGAKPFKCDRCDYSCVNKSMLNSHLKSHSKVYQYRCQDCLYETKYCHSLKLHLRKYKHKPAMVLNPDGSPNPLPIIDVYGTRRGPKVKRGSQSGLHPDEDSMSPPVNTSMEHNPQSPLIPNPFSSLMMNQGQLPFPFPLLPGFPGTVPNPEILQNIQRIMRERFEEMQRQNQATELNEPNSETVLDLSKHPNDETPEQSDDEDESQPEHTTMFSNVEVVDDEKNEQAHEPMEESTADSTIQEKSEEIENKSSNNNNKYDFSCQFCEISFNNEVMFRIHMGYHGFKSVFTCNMCGEDCNDKVNFFLHIARAAH